MDWQNEHSIIRSSTFVAWNFLSDFEVTGVGRCPRSFLRQLLRYLTPFAPKHKGATIFTGTSARKYCPSFRATRVRPELNRSPCFEKLSVKETEPETSTRSPAGVARSRRPRTDCCFLH